MVIKIQAVKDLAQDMREKYSQTRSRHSLAESKGLETQVDRALQWFEKEGEHI